MTTPILISTSRDTINAISDFGFMTFSDEELSVLILKAVNKSRAGKSVSIFTEQNLSATGVSLALQRFGIVSTTALGKDEIKTAITEASRKNIPTWSREHSTVCLGGPPWPSKMVYIDFIKSNQKNSPWPFWDSRTALTKLVSTLVVDINDEKAVDLSRRFITANFFPKIYTVKCSIDLPHEEIEIKDLK